MVIDKSEINFEQFAAILKIEPKKLSYIIYKIPDEQKYKTFKMKWYRYSGNLEKCFIGTKLLEVKNDNDCLEDKCQCLNKPLNI